MVSGSQSLILLCLAAVNIGTSVTVGEPDCRDGQDDESSCARPAHGSGLLQVTVNFSQLSKGPAIAQEGENSTLQEDEVLLDPGAPPLEEVATKAAHAENLDTSADSQAEEVVDASVLSGDDAGAPPLEEVATKAAHAENLDTSADSQADEVVDASVLSGDDAAAPPLEELHRWRRLQQKQAAEDVRLGGADEAETTVKEAYASGDTKLGDHLIDDHAMALVQAVNKAKGSAWVKGTYRIQNVVSRYYLTAGSLEKDSPNDSVVQIQKSDWRGGLGQDWDIDARGRIRNTASGKYLVAASYGLTNEHGVFQKADSGPRTGWTWKLEEQDEIKRGERAIFKIGNEESGQYLVGNTQTIGNHVWQYPDHSSTSDTFFWELKPVGGCGATPVIGEWAELGWIHHTFGHREKYGWSRTSGSGGSTSWSDSVETSHETSFQAKGVSASSSVTLKSTSGSIDSWSESRKMTGEREITVTIPEQGMLWQWRWTLSNRCGEALLSTMSFVVTHKKNQPPCCPPGEWLDNTKYHGQCLAGSECLCGEPICPKKCEDKYQGCPAYVAWCRNTPWLRENCKKTCGTC